MKVWSKRVLSVLATVGMTMPMVMSVGSTSASAASSGMIKVGVALSYNNTAFWSAYVSYEQQFAKQMGVHLIGPLVCCDTYGSNSTLQNQQVKDLVKEGAQAIILNPEDASAEGPSIAYASAHHVAIISVDTILGAGKDYVVVRASNLFYGYSACSYIASKVKSGYVVDNEGQQVSSNGHDRAVGFNDCMAKLDPSGPCLVERHPLEPEYRAHRLRRPPSTPTTTRSRPSTTSTAAPTRGSSSSSTQRASAPPAAPSPT